MPEYIIFWDDTFVTSYPTGISPFKRYGGIIFKGTKSQLEEKLKTMREQGYTTVDYRIESESRLEYIKRKYKNILEKFPTLEKVIKIKGPARITGIEVRPTCEMPNISASDIDFRVDSNYEYYTYTKKIDGHILHEYHKRDNLGYEHIHLVIYANEHVEEK